MKQMSLGLILFMVTGSALMAKDTAVNLTIPSEDVNRVFLNVEGLIFLENSADMDIHIEVSTEIQGEVHGFSNHESIPRYEVETTLDENILMITPKTRTPQWSVGFSTRSETHIHTIQIPRDMNVEILSRDSKVAVQGEYRTLAVLNHRGEIETTIPDKSLRYLKCTTETGAIKVNENVVESGFTYADSGNYVVELNTSSGSITITSNLSGIELSSHSLTMDRAGGSK